MLGEKLAQPVSCAGVDEPVLEVDQVIAVPVTHQFSLVVKRPKSHPGVILRTLGSIAVVTPGIHLLTKRVNSYIDTLTVVSTSVLMR